MLGRTEMTLHGSCDRRAQACWCFVVCNDRHMEGEKVTLVLLRKMSSTDVHYLGLGEVLA